MKILKSADLKLGDVVCYHYQSSYRWAFMDMEVTYIDDKGVYLRRPYIDSDSKEACLEQLFWAKDSNFQFDLLERVAG